MTKSENSCIKNVVWLRPGDPRHTHKEDEELYKKIAYGIRADLEIINGYDRDMIDKLCLEKDLIIIDADDFSYEGHRGRLHDPLCNLATHGRNNCQHLDSQVELHDLLIRWGKKDPNSNPYLTPPHFTYHDQNNLLEYFSAFYDLPEIRIARQIKAVKEILYSKKPLVYYTVRGINWDYYEIGRSREKNFFAGLFNRVIELSDSNEPLGSSHRIGSDRIIDQIIRDCLEDAKTLAQQDKE
jgi:hypothetical protein